MELNGALSNPLQRHKDLLARLSDIASTLPPGGPFPRRRRRLPPRAGGIKAAVIEAVGETPLTLREIHTRCEKLLGRRVRYRTVKDCVHKHARGRDPVFERIRHGVYRQRC
jgi:hypothetical protein